MSVSGEFEGDISKIIKSELIDIEARITRVEKLLGINCSLPKVETETIQRPFWAEGGWTCSLCFEVLRDNKCDCK